MSEINKKICKELLKCNWLENCGTNNFNDYIVEEKYENFDNLYIRNSTMKNDISIYLIKDKKEVIKCISSIKWENLCLDIRGKLSTFLAVNKDITLGKFNKWNNYVDKIKIDYLDNIEGKILSAVKLKNYPDDVFYDIRSNILLMFMYNIYSEFYYDDFFENILHVYLSGHLVCGWYGKYPKGKLMVY